MDFLAGTAISVGVQPLNFIGAQDLLILEQYLESHSEAAFTHSFCPDCAKMLYPDYKV